jgi:hypothetical protein
MICDQLHKYLIILLLYQFTQTLITNDSKVKITGSKKLIDTVTPSPKLYLSKTISSKLTTREIVSRIQNIIIS